MLEFCVSSAIKTIASSERGRTRGCIDSDENKMSEAGFMITAQAYGLSQDSQQHPAIYWAK